MLNSASQVAYGRTLISCDSNDEASKKKKGPRVQKHKTKKSSVQSIITELHIGDSVMVYPEKKIESCDIRWNVNSWRGR